MDLPTSPESYEPHIRELFALPQPDGTAIELTLSAVKRHRDDEIQRSFSLFFLGKISSALPAHLYRLGHPRLGELDLFLVPIQRKQDGILYESVFNLLKGELQ